MKYAKDQQDLVDIITQAFMPLPGHSYTSHLDEFYKISKVISKHNITKHRITKDYNKFRNLAKASNKEYNLTACVVYIPYGHVIPLYEIEDNCPRFNRILELHAIT
jgi:hypothetical protein